MKRDLDLIRKLLLLCEDLPYPNFMSLAEFDGYSVDQINYHLVLLDDAGYILVSVDKGGDNTIEVVPIRLTWQGHELLDAARSDKRWEEAKSVFRSIGGFTVDLLKTFLVDLISRDIRLLS